MTVSTDRIRGSITALITPFKNGELDEESLRNIIAWQIGEGTNGLVPVGTTGESPTLSHKEHMRVVALCVQVAGGRVPVIAGAGSNSTREAIELTRHAKEVGADAALSVAPYYNKPTQEGLYRHFAATAIWREPAATVLRSPKTSSVCRVRMRPLWVSWRMAGGAASR